MIQIIQLILNRITWIMKKGETYGAYNPIAKPTKRTVSRSVDPENMDSLAYLVKSETSQKKIRNKKNKRKDNSSMDN
jgi:hypothetical protein